MNDLKQTDAPQPPANRRRNLRSPLLALKVRIEDGDRCFFGYTKNISRSGMFVATLQTLPPESEVPVSLHLPPPIDRLLECRCAVVWNRSYVPNSPYEPGVGLRFVDLDTALESDIEDWVQQQSSD